MATINALRTWSKPCLLVKPTQTTLSSLSFSNSPTTSFRRPLRCRNSSTHRVHNRSEHNPKTLSAGLILGLGAGLTMSLVGPTSASELLQLSEPSNALSLPTWAIHISSVVEWITAMILVWQYGEISGNETWKGLSWGMVPLLGGAFCACTWHFFYNSESLEILVALQAALTAIGNATMCYAAFRIYKASQERSKKNL